MPRCRYQKLASASLVQLAGLQPAGDDEIAAKLAVTVAGSLRDGFTTDIQAELYGPVQL